MKRNLQLGLFFAALLMFSPAASAQRKFSHGNLYSPAPRAMAARPVHPMIVPTAGPMTVRLPVSPAVRRIVITRGAPATMTQTAPSTSFGVSPDSFDSSAAPVALGQLLNPVPGLGFDYSNLAAINQDLGVRALIDPVTQQELALAERLAQETPSPSVGFPLFDSGSQPVVLEQPAPQVIFVQQPAPRQEAAPEASSSAPPAPAAEQPPLPDVGELILVLHDGAQIKAVAFTRQKDRIVYITKDGLRQSFPISELDTHATLRLNNQRGTPLQLPL